MVSIVTAKIQAIIAQSISASQASSDDSQQDSSFMTATSQVSSWAPPWLPSPPPPTFHISPHQVGDYWQHVQHDAAVCSSRQHRELTAFGFYFFIFFWLAAEILWI